jgi:DNA-binding IclR family transcriptional regulator
MARRREWETLGPARHCPPETHIRAGRRRVRGQQRGRGAARAGPGGLTPFRVPPLTDATPLLPGAGRNQSLARAFQVLDCLAAHPAGVSVAALSRASGLPRATVTRLLGSLADEGAARRDGGEWRLGPRIALLARGLAPPLPERAGPVLEALAAELGETVMLAVPDGPAGARVVAEAAGPRMVGVGSWLGRTLEDPASGFVRLRLAALDPAARRRAVAGLRFTAHTASTIRAARPLLAALQDIARERYAEVVDEFEQGLAGLAVPLHENGRLVAMLAVYLPTARLDDAMRAQALATLRRAAQSLIGASETTISSSSSHTR